MKYLLFYLVSETGTEPNVKVFTVIEQNDHVEVKLCEQT